MTKKKIILCSLMNSLATLIYVALVSLVLTNGESIFGRMSDIAGPTIFLLLFVLSAGITGGLVLGKPVMKYLDGDKKGAVYLFCATLGWLFIFTAMGLVVNLIF